MMFMMVIVFAVFVSIFLLFFLFSASSNSTVSENVAELVDWDAIADAELQSYLPNQKINAIKRYRELTDVGLKEAKESVEYAMRNPEGRKKSRSPRRIVDTDGAGVRDLIAEGRIEEAIDIYASFMGIDEYSARDAINEMRRELEVGSRLSDDNFDTVRDLVEQGKKIEAIKVYRELTGTSLKEAKDFVDDMER